MNFINPFDLSRLFKNKGDQSLARIADINTVKEYVDSKDEWQETIVEISSAQIINDLLTDNISQGLELLPTPGHNKYYHVTSVAVESTIITPFQIFSGTDEENLQQFPFGIYTDSQQISSLNSSFILGTSMSIVLNTLTPGFILDNGDIAFYTPGTNLENKSVYLNLRDVGNGNFLPPYTITGEGSLRLKIRYRILTKGE